MDHAVILITSAVVHHNAFIGEVVGKSPTFLVETGALHFRRYLFIDKQAVGRLDHIL